MEATRGKGVGMGLSNYYRTEAEQCRKLAAASPESPSAKRWRQLAAEYDELAETLEAEGPGLVRPGPVQRQPMQQQQQAKTTPEDEKE